MTSKYGHFSRRTPDTVTEELVVALSSAKPYEFKALFLVIHAALRARKATTGGEEMLRLRTYEKLQFLVQHGQVKKEGKIYRGLKKPLQLLADQMREFRKSLQEVRPPQERGSREG